MHIFNLLGSGKAYLGKKINWHQDVKFKYIWPKLNLDEIRRFVYSHFDKGKDIRIPWELSRFYHLIPLSLAFYRTSNLKYLLEFEIEILNWIDDNPMGFGINWFNAMEASIRVCNWIFSFQVFNLALASIEHNWSKGFVWKFISSIFDHGNFILHNLENVPATNHYIADLVGLLYIGLTFPELKISKDLIKTSIYGLEKEIQNQVYEDGVDYELSLSYHRFVTELFLYSSLLCKINNVYLSSDYLKKLKQMIFLFLYIQNTTEVFQILEIMIIRDCILFLKIIMSEEKTLISQL